MCSKDDSEGGRVTNIISISLGAARPLTLDAAVAADGHVFALSSFVFKARRSRNQKEAVVEGWMNRLRNQEWARAATAAPGMSLKSHLKFSSQFLLNAFAGRERGREERASERGVREEAERRSCGKTLCKKCTQFTRTAELCERPNDHMFNLCQRSERIVDINCLRPDRETYEY